MLEKLTELHQLLQTAGDEDMPYQEAIPNQRITEQGNEVLAVFGLPSHQGYEAILIKLGDVIDLSDELVDAMLIELADAGLDYQTLSKLSEI